MVTGRGGGVDQLSSSLWATRQDMMLILMQRGNWATDHIHSKTSRQSKSSYTSLHDTVAQVFTCKYEISEYLDQSTLPFIELTRGRGCPHLIHFIGLPVSHENTVEFCRFWKSVVNLLGMTWSLLMYHVLLSFLHCNSKFSGQDIRENTILRLHEGFPLVSNAWLQCTVSQGLSTIWWVGSS